MGLEKTEHIGRIVVHPTDPEHRLRRGARRHLAAEPGARPLQDRRRRQDLAAGQVHQRQGRLRRRRDRSVESRTCSGRRAGSASAARTSSERRPGLRALEDAPTPARPGPRSRAAACPRRRRAASASRSRAATRSVMYAMVEADTMPNPKPAAGAKAAGAAQRALSLRGRRRDVGEDARRRTCAPSTTRRCASIRRTRTASTARRRRSLLERRRQDRAQRDAGTARRPSRDVDRPERSGPHHRRQRRRHRRHAATRAATTSSPTSLPLGQFYNVSYDMAVPYNVCGGLQDNGSWCGPEPAAAGPITNAHWFNVAGGDGFVTAQDPTRPEHRLRRVAGRQHRPARLRDRRARHASQKPNWRPRYRSVRGLDHRRARRHDASPRRRSRRRASRSSARRADARTRSTCSLRWNWNTPFFLSPHNPHVVLRRRQPRDEVDEARRRPVRRSRPTSPRATR